MGRFQEFTFGELASLGSGFQVVSKVSGFQCFRGSGVQGFETSSLNPFSVEKGLVNERF